MEVRAKEIGARDRDIEENVVIEENTVIEGRTRNKTADLNEDETPSLGSLIKHLNEAFCSKTILGHHLTFANDCVSHSIYHIGLKTFVPCVAHRADDALRKKWKQVLNNKSLELLALCRSHYSTLLEKTKDEIDR